MHTLCWCVLLAVGLCLTGTHGARILGIFPTASISHQLPFQAIMKALAARGHQVTVISTDPLKPPRANYTDIDVSFTYRFFQSQHDMNTFVSMTPYQVMEIFMTMGEKVTRMQLNSEGVQRFIKSNQTFDLAFIECLGYQSYYGLIHHVGSPPIIGILSLGGLVSSFDMVANPNNPAYDPDIVWHYDDHMTFLQRLNNMAYGVWFRYRWASNMDVQERVMRQYFGQGPASVKETEKNISLVMVNNHWTMSYPRPLMTNFIELGNLHLKTEKNPLPKDLASFLNGAVDGFIYFSLGSNVRSDKLSPEKRQHFLDAFAALPQRVLWKWESDEMPGKPQNVMLGKWLPQSDILGASHPNIRLFMTQGGLQSMGEAVQNAVPLVGIPFMGDQRYNVRKMVSAGIGQELDFHDLTKDKIIKTLKLVLNNPRYRQNMKKFSAVSKDQPETSLERAVWWTEYVIRHKGAPHLRSAAMDLSWTQYLLLDVFAFLAVLLVAVLLLLYFVLTNCYRIWKKYWKLKKE